MNQDALDRRSLFARLLVRHDRELLAYIMTFVPRRDDAEEVLQRTAIVLWERFADFDEQRGFAPWAVRHAYFEILNFRKENARSRLVFREDLMNLLVDAREERAPLLHAQREALRSCLQQLDPQSRTLLRQRYSDSEQRPCDAESIADLARAAGKSAKSLYRRLYKLRLRVARCVERRLASDPPFA